MLVYFEYREAIKLRALNARFSIMRMTPKRLLPRDDTGIEGIMAASGGETPRRPAPGPRCHAISLAAATATRASSSPPPRVPHEDAERRQPNNALTWRERSFGAVYRADDRRRLAFSVALLASCTRENAGPVVKMMAGLWRLMKLLMKRYNALHLYRIIY